VCLCVYLCVPVCVFMSACMHLCVVVCVCACVCVCLCTYLLMRIYVWMVFDKTAFGTGESIGYTIKLNNSIVARQELEAATTTTEAVQEAIDLIIPPMTSVEIIGDTDGGAIVVTGILTGRIYA